jgi:hypothetical protein
MTDFGASSAEPWVKCYSETGLIYYFYNSANWPQVRIYMQNIIHLAGQSGCIMGSCCSGPDRVEPTTGRATEVGQDRENLYWLIMIQSCKFLVNGWLLLFQTVVETDCILCLEMLIILLFVTKQIITYDFIIISAWNGLVYASTLYQNFFLLLNFIPRLLFSKVHMVCFSVML